MRLPILLLPLALLTGTLSANAQDSAGVKTYTVVDGAIDEPLATPPGIAADGRTIMTGKALGNCLACHKITALNTEAFQGEMGPVLDGVATRWNEGQLRLIVSNAKMMFPDTIMPAFYRNEGLNRVRPELAGKPILTARQVEDVVAFLKTLTK